VQWQHRCRRSIARKARPCALQALQPLQPLQPQQAHPEAPLLLRHKVPNEQHAYGDLRGAEVRDKHSDGRAIVRMHGETLQLCNACSHSPLVVEAQQTANATTKETQQLRCQQKLMSAVT
jgi:hypothetical protein